ncbi:MAG: type I-C CRISPR-associated endonuclease Cas1c [Oligosphaeraceae bacterium]
MKRLLNTLYLTRQDAWLHREGETLVVEKDGERLLKVPVCALTSVVIFGNVLVSPWALGLCMEHGIAVSMLTEQGKFLARVEGAVEGSVHLRLSQMRAYESPSQKDDLARTFVIGKVCNARAVLARCIRDHGESDNLLAALETLNCVLARLRDSSLEARNVRGLEGEAASAYFAAFNDMICSQKDFFAMSSRNRRPPMDPMNAVLSFLYTLLAHDCRGALEGVGLDPQIGFLHELRSGRPSLALDLMEEFRAPMADRVALSLVNLRQLSSKDFHFLETGMVQIKEEGKKKLLVGWQEKKKEELMHPFLKEKVPIGLLPHVQAMLLTRYLRGDLDAYPPFLLR